MHPSVDAPLLHYKRLLWLLSAIFSNREFTTVEASQRLVERFDLLGFRGMNLQSTRLRPKLVLNDLRRLKPWNLVKARRVPRSVTTKSGKRVNRGFMNVWHLTPKAFTFLRTTKAEPLDTKGLFKALQRERQRFAVREDPHYVYSRVFALRAQIDSLLFSPHKLTQEEVETLNQRVKEYEKLMAEIRTQKKPNKDITAAVLRAIADANRFNEKTAPRGR